MPGPGTSVAEVTHVSRHAFWLSLDAEELLVPFALCPWFRTSTIDQLVEVKWPTPDHLYWPQSDVALSVASIQNPDDFPLVANVKA